MWSDDELARRESALAALVRRIWRAIGRQVAGSIQTQRTVTAAHAGQVIPEWHDALENQVLGFVRDTYVDGAGAVAETTGVPLGEKIGADLVEAYLSETRGRLWEIGDEVWNVVRTQIAQGQQAGESVNQIAARVKNVAGVSDARALTIARTEVHAALEAGAYEQALFVDPDGTKTWIDTNDSHTRPTHRAADGQTVTIGGTFQVGDSRLRYPGDPLGEPSETISCRCSVAYDFDTITPVDETSDDDDVAVTAAGRKFDPKKHPRGKDGKFIKKGDVLAFLTQKKPTVDKLLNAVMALDAEQWHNLKPEQQKQITDAADKLPTGSATKTKALEKIVDLSLGAPPKPAAETKTPAKPKAAISQQGGIAGLSGDELHAQLMANDEFAFWDNVKDDLTPEQWQSLSSDQKYKINVKALDLENESDWESTSAVEKLTKLYDRDSGDAVVAPTPAATVSPATAKQQLLKDTVSQMMDAQTTDDWAKLEEKFKTEAAKIDSGKPDVGALTDFSGMKKVGGQAGSNVGGTFESPEGQRYYVKKAKSAQHASNEVAASQFYALAGIDVPQVIKGENATGLGSGLQTASRMVPNAKSNLKTKLGDSAYKKKVQEGFAIDAWLANWDVAGLSYDNIVTDADGKPHRIDVGGALLYRAQGKPKGTAFGNTVTELKTMRTGSVNAQAAALFGDMTDDDIRASAAKLATISESDIDQVVANSGLPSHVATTLKNRRQDILNKYPPLDTFSPSPSSSPSPLLTSKMKPGDITAADAFALLNQYKPGDVVGKFTYKKNGVLKSEYEFRKSKDGSGIVVYEKPAGMPSFIAQKKYTSAEEMSKPGGYPFFKKVSPPSISPPPVSVPTSTPTPAISVLTIPDIPAHKGVMPGSPAKITTGLIWGKHPDGTVIVEDPNADERIVWNGATKKYDLQSIGPTGTWATTKSFTKKDAYAEFKNDTSWKVPGGSLTPTSTTPTPTSSTTTDLTPDNAAKLKKFQKEYLAGITTHDEYVADVQSIPGAPPPLTEVEAKILGKVDSQAGVSSDGLIENWQATLLAPYSPGDTIAELPGGKTKLVQSPDSDYVTHTAWSPGTKSWVTLGAYHKMDVPLNLSGLWQVPKKTSTSKPAVKPADTPAAQATVLNESVITNWPGVLNAKYETDEVIAYSADGTQQLVQSKMDHIVKIQNKTSDGWVTDKIHTKSVAPNTLSQKQWVVPPVKKPGVVQTSTLPKDQPVITNMSAVLKKKHVPGAVIATSPDGQAAVVQSGFNSNTVSLHQNLGGTWTHEHSTIKNMFENDPYVSAISDVWHMPAPGVAGLYDIKTDVDVVKLSPGTPIIPATADGDTFDVYLPKGGIVNPTPYNQSYIDMLEVINSDSGYVFVSKAIDFAADIDQPSFDQLLPKHKAAIDAKLEMGIQSNDPGINEALQNWAANTLANKNSAADAVKVGKKLSFTELADLKDTPPTVHNKIIATSLDNDMVMVENTAMNSWSIYSKQGDGSWFQESTHDAYGYAGVDFSEWASDELGGDEWYAPPASVVSSNGPILDTDGYSGAWPDTAAPTSTPSDTAPAPSVSTPTPSPTPQAAPLTPVPGFFASGMKKHMTTAKVGYWSKPEKIWDEIKKIQAAHPDVNNSGQSKYTPLQIMQALDAQLKTKEPTPYETKMVKWAGTANGQSYLAKTGDSVTATNVPTALASHVGLPISPSELWEAVAKTTSGIVLATGNDGVYDYELRTFGQDVRVMRRPVGSTESWVYYGNIQNGDDDNMYLSNALYSWKKTAAFDTAGVPLASTSSPTPPSPTPSTPSVTNAPLDLGSSSIDHLTPEKKQSIYDAFKKQPSTYLTSPHVDVYAALKSIAEDNGLSTMQAIAIVDEVGAKKVNSANKHLFQKKIVDWLKTPQGAAVASGKPIPKPPTPAFSSSVNNSTNIPSFEESSKYTYDTITVTKATQLSNESKAASPAGDWTPTQKSGLKAYTGGIYYSINSYLFGSVDTISASNEKAMKNAQLGMRPSTKPMLLHRGVGWGGITDAKSHDQLVKKIGTTWKSDGFNSTSVGGAAAFGGKPVIVEVEAPPGTPMAWVKPISNFPSENEMLLAAGLHYQIVSVKKVGGKSYVRVRVVPAPEETA
jgi:hypothetical protein